MAEKNKILRCKLCKKGKSKLLKIGTSLAFVLKRTAACKKQKVIPVKKV